MEERLRRHPSTCRGPYGAPSSQVKAQLWTTPEAEAQAEAVDSWWRENRPASPTLFLDELANAFQLLAEAPEIGTRYDRTSIPGLRRLLLKASRHHLYYVYEAAQAQVIVLAIWGSQKGVGPTLG